MTVSDRQEIQNELVEAIRSGNLPANMRPKAERLLSRIVDPVRLTLLGMPGSGKSTLANLLLGSNVFPEGIGLSTVQIKKGAQPKSTCTMADGNKVEFDHCDCTKLAAQKPIFLEMEMPLPALDKISLTEVVTSGDLIELERAMAWSAKRTDIAIWCTAIFDDTEQDLWRRMPGDLKDHAILLITKADIMAMDGDMRGIQMQLDPLINAEFKHVLSIKTKEAVRAREADGAINKQKLAESGGRALISAILRDVDQGIQAAIDQADVMLRQYQLLAMPVAQQTPGEVEAHEPPKQPAPPVKPKPEPAKNQPVKAKPDKVDPTKAEHLFNKNRIAYTRAVDALSETGRDLIGETEKNDTISDDDLMEMSSERVTWLHEHLEDHGDAADPHLKRMLDAASGASDLVQLMQLEGTSQAAMDAVSLVVQLKRDLESELAKVKAG